MTSFEFTQQALFMVRDIAAWAADSARGGDREFPEEDLRKFLLLTRDRLDRLETWDDRRS